MNQKIHPLTGLLLLAGMGCAAGTAKPWSGKTGDGQGLLQVAMQQQASDGAVYFLRDASLRLSGQLETTILVGDTPVLQQALPPGAYQMELLAGWRMERQLAGEALQEIDAELVSQNPLDLSIRAGQTTAVTLRFRVPGASEIGFETGDVVVGMQVEPALDGGAPDDPWRSESPDASTGCQGLLLINEVDYDQPNADQAEFVELFNPSDCMLSTEDLRLELVNGARDEAKVYAGIQLDPAGPFIAPGGYLVVGSAAVVEALPEAVPGIAVSPSIQNGDPDGVLLRRGQSVLDSLSYGGVIAGVTEGAPAPTDLDQGSIGRCANGVDTDDNGADFAFNEIPTPGAENQCAR